MINDPLHPYQVTVLVASTAKAKNLQFCLARYTRIPGTKNYKRTINWVDSGSLEAKTIELIENLSPGEELAIHSTVITDGQLKHIPMIDFQHPNLSICLQRSAEILGQEEIESYAFYNSGRSYHAYKANLISCIQWRALMGKLLLVNPKDSNHPIVDARWIGHRLIAGYSALRWSCNSGRYEAIPNKVLSARLQNGVHSV